MNGLKRIAFASFLALATTSLSAQSVDLRVPFDRLMDEGAAAYMEGRHEDAVTAFRDARLIRPQSPEAIHNLGLAEARLGNFDTARELFRESRRHLPPQEHRRAESLYNEGTAWLDEAIASLQDEDTASQAPDQLLEAIQLLGETLQVDPAHERAKYNRLAAQNMLLQMEPPPPPPPGSGESEDEEEGEDEESESSSQHSEEEQDQDEEGESDSDSQDQSEQQDPSEEEESDSQQQPQQQDQDQDQSPPADAESDPMDSDEQEGEPEASEGPPPLPERPEEMTPEQARQLLNLLGNRDLMIFRQPRDSQPPPGGRDW